MCPGSAGGKPTERIYSCVAFFQYRNPHYKTGTMPFTMYTLVMARHSTIFLCEPELEICAVQRFIFFEYSFKRLGWRKLLNETFHQQRIKVMKCLKKNYEYCGCHLILWQNTGPEIQFFQRNSYSLCFSSFSQCYLACDPLKISLFPPKCIPTMQKANWRHRLA